MDPQLRDLNLMPIDSPSLPKPQFNAPANPSAEPATSGITTERSEGAPGDPSYGRPRDATFVRPGEVNFGFPVGDAIQELERFLPPCVQHAPDEEKVKYLEAIVALYRRREESRMLMHRNYQLTVQKHYKVKNFEDWLAEVHLKKFRPNSMSRFGAVLDDLGMRQMLDDLIKHVVSPLASVLLSEFGGGSLDSHHAYTIEYHSDGDKDIGFHIDDSEVTLNVCLGRQFEGGEIYFRGVRCTQHMQFSLPDEEVVEFKNELGRAVLHAGRHRHAAKPVSKGERVNMVLWCRSSQFRRELPPAFLCPSWCGCR